jgi:hypothetical protein
VITGKVCSLGGRLGVVLVVMGRASTVLYTPHSVDSVVSGPIGLNEVNAVALGGQGQLG